MTSPSTDVLFGANSSLAIKAPVRVATTASITLSGEQTIDGVAVVADDRVLVKDQSTASQNGIYIADTSSWERAPDFDGNRDIVKGTTVRVTDGALGAGIWRVTTANPIVIGTTSIAFTQDTTADASAVSFIQAGTGAVTRTAQNKMRDIFSAADFGFLTSATAAANKTALVAAIAAVIAAGAGDIFIPKGVYACNPDIQIDGDLVGIRGAGPGQTYGEVVGGTEIDFGAGTNGFTLDFFDGGGAGSYCRIADLSIDGQGNIAKGIYIQGQVTIDNVQVSGCTAAGIHIADLANTIELNKVSCVANTGGTGYGLLIDGTSNTAFMVDKCVFRQNTVGVRIENALHCAFNGCVIESNTNEGLYIYKPTGGNLGWITFNSCWFESNNVGTSNYQIKITSQTLNLTTGPANYITFNQPMINGTGTVRHMHIESCIGFTINEPVLNSGDQTNSIVLGTNAYHGVIIDKTNGGIVNGGTLCYERINQSVDFSGGLAGGMNMQTAYLSQIKFPATQVASTNANTFDDYEEGDWTPIDASGAALSFTTPGGTYTKYGRDFRASSYLQYPATADASTATIGGLPFTVTNANEARQGFISDTSETTAVRLNVTNNSTTFLPRTNAGGAITNATMSTDFIYTTIFTHV